MNSKIWQRHDIAYPGESIDPDREIRVLHLHAGQYQDDVVVVLKSQPIDWDHHSATSDDSIPNSNSQSSAYEALSYAWGDENDICHVLYHGGGKLAVTRNLYNALRRLRSTTVTRRIWIDQLCIDQSCIDERNRQISHMEWIYWHAAKVLIWLGDATTTENEPPGSNRQRYKQLEEAITRTDPSWWTRGWVVQEFANAQHERIFYFGACQMQHGELDDLIRKQFFSRTVTFRSFKIKETLANVAVFYHITELETRQKSILRLQILALTDCSDPRDKVYSLFTFMNDEEKALIKPDYKKTVDAVYAEATYTWIVARRSLSVLVLISTARCRSRSIPPSWAVDFQALRLHHLRLLPLTREPHFFMKMLRYTGLATNDFELDWPASDPWCKLQPKNKPKVAFDPNRLTLGVTALRFDSVRLAFDVKCGSKAGSWLHARLPIEKRWSMYSDVERGIYEEIYRSVSDGTPYERLLTHQRPEEYRDLNDTPGLSKDVQFTLSLVDHCLRAWDTLNKDGVVSVGTLDVGLNVTTMFHGGTFFMTEAGFLGLGPPGIEAEDLVTLPYGSRYPIVLGQVDGEEMWEFKGLTYVHGIMDGDLLERLPDVEFEEREFILR